MSNIGLNSNIYHSTRSYLDLLNDFLIDVNYAKEIGTPYVNEDVVNFFKKVSDRSITDPEIQLVRSFFNRFFKDRNKNTEKELTTITQHIQKADYRPELLKSIEELVEVLKFQCAQSYARMKGIQ